jgi:hypothetical protein
MEKYLDILAFREAKGGKKFAIKCGSASLNKDEDGYNCYIDAMPAPVEGQYRIALVPRKEKGEQKQGTQTASQGPADLGDDVPFAPNRGI